ncbi:MAG: FG-GAP-like repeat-containing protein [Candidatus Syntrophosphaera sp.]
MKAIKSMFPSTLVRCIQVLALLVFSGAFTFGFAQTDYFVDDVNDLFGLWYSDSVWGDFDDDHDLDLLMVGYGLTSGQGNIKFYRNDGNSIFNLVDNAMVGTGNGSAGFADLDGDNDLDILICGQVETGVDITKVYVNNAGVYEDCGYEFPPRVSSSVSFGDYDNDGDLDILLSGGTVSDTSVAFLQIFRNEGSFDFTQVDVTTSGIKYGNADFGDYDNDGWLDIAYAGRTSTGDYVSRILRGSQDGTFTDINAPLEGLRYSRIFWADYDSDGDLDVILSGSFDNAEPSPFHVYRNDGNDVFTDVLQPNVSGERQGDVVWGDINNDGYGDIIVNGLVTTTSWVADVYLYNPQNGLFENTQTMTYLKYAAMALGDYNNDGKLDLSLSGRYDFEDYWNELYLNASPIANTAPQAPDNLNSPVLDDAVTLSWDAAQDAETPAAGLTYNVRVGTIPGGCDIVGPMADPATGWRKIAAQGNAGQRLERQISGLPDGDYYWSVQALDNSYAGSPFAGEQVFTIGEVSNQENVQPVIERISNHPNPFHLSTMIRFELKESALTSAGIYNIRGQLVRTLCNGDLRAGIHEFAWHGKGTDGKALPSGVYTLRVQSSSTEKNHRMVLIK